MTHLAYVDCSNLFIEGQKVSAVAKGMARSLEDARVQGGDDDPPPRQKVKIKLADGKERTIQHMMATTFWSVDGRPMSAVQFVTRLFGELPALFEDEDELHTLWSQPDTRRALLDNLGERGYGSEQLREIKRLIDAGKKRSV